MAIKDLVRHAVGRVREATQRQGAPCRLIVGLGNPGQEYLASRHNVGFRVVEELARRWHLDFRLPRNQSRLASGDVAGLRVAVLEPLTYMNLSGNCVARAVRQLGLTPEHVMVIHDDVDLPFGRLRLRSGGSAGGHRGVQSIIDLLGASDFARLRVGIGRPSDGDIREYVLSPFTQEEERNLDAVLGRAVSAIECYLTDGIEVAMNRYNG